MPSRPWLLAHAALILLTAACAAKAPKAGGGQGQPGGGSAGSGAADAGKNNSFSNPDGAMADIGTGAGTGDASIDGAKVDDNHCGSTSIDTTTEMTEVPGNILVVYDKSGSMNEAWNLPDGTPSTKLIAAGKAFTDAIIPTATKVNVGTIFFPSSSNCGVDALNSGKQIDMMTGTAYLNAWVTYWNSNKAGGNTPLLEALKQADATLTNTTFTGTTVVMVITDGDPNCGWDATMANGLATKWLGNGVKTYVIGLPGTSNNGVTVLNDLAVAGGTTMFFNTTDSMALQTQINMISTQTVTTQLNSCKIKLNPPPPAADKVVMVATEKGMMLSVPRDLGANAGWTINAAGTEVELTGLLCRDAKAGRFTKITFQYGCVDLPPIPPPTPG